MPRTLAACLALSLLGAALPLGGCTSSPAPTAAAQNTDHKTAASGFGLGPEDFRSNGGAFGPDQLSH